METIEDDGGRRTSIRHLEDVAPGSRRVGVIPGEAPEPRRPFRVEDLPRHEIARPFAADESFRREGLHGDDGR